MDPLDGLREALANAVCHRDYGMANDIQVKVFENRVVIINPGQLPFDMSLADLENPDHPSRPRNKLIAQVFYDLHVIEHYGSGVRRIRNDCDKNGSPYPVWQSEHGECTIKFFARTKESIAKLGINPEKFGVVVDGESGAMDAEKVTENRLQVAQKGAEVAQKRQQVAQKGAEVAQKRQQVTQKLTGKGRTDAIANALAVYDVIVSNEDCTIDEMSNATSLANGSVKNALRLLRANGIIDRQGEDRGGKWIVIV